MKYKTVKDAMVTVEGKALFQILKKQFRHALALDPALAARMERLPSALGSQRQLEEMVWASLNGLEQVKKAQKSHTSDQVSASL